MSKITAVYLRVSTETQTHDSQEQSCMQWCEAHGMEPVLYKDTASGASTSRKSLDALMADVRADKVACIVCYKLDRLGRSLMHLAQMAGELEKRKVALICTSQGIDTREENPAGRLQMHVLMAVAEFERSLIRERTKAGMKAARERGSQIGRKPGFKTVHVPVKEFHASGMSMRAWAKAKGLALSTVRREIKNQAAVLLIEESASP